MHCLEALASRDQLRHIMLEVLSKQGMLSEAERKSVLQRLCRSRDKKPSEMQRAYENEH